MKMRLREIRGERGWTIDHVADLTGLSRGFVSQLETGKRLPSASTLDLFAEVYGIGVADLIDGQDEAAEIARVVAAMASMRPEDQRSLAVMAEALAGKGAELRRISRPVESDPLKA